MNGFVKLARMIMPRPLRTSTKRKAQDLLDVPTTYRSFMQLRELGFRPDSAVDIGAFKGEWTLLTRQIFPETSVLMLEAQRGQQADLEMVKRTAPDKIDYRIALLGPENRDDVVFHEYEAPTDSSVLSILKSSGAREVRCAMRTLDTVLAEAGVTKPELIKIDVQGYELEVLKGATKTLQTLQVLLMEVSLVDLYEGNPLLRDVVNFMHERGFVTYDVCGLLRRPEDQTLAQLDMIFVSANSPLLKRKK